MILLVVLVQLIFTFNYYHLISGSTSSGTTPGASIITVTAATTTIGSTSSSSSSRVNNKNTNVDNNNNNNNKNSPLELSSFVLRREGGQHTTGTDTDSSTSTTTDSSSSNVLSTSLQEQPQQQQQHDLDPSSTSTFPFFFRGVQFERDVVSVVDGIKNMTLMFDKTVGAKNCDVIDQYGHNKCKFHWSDNMTGTLEATSLPFDLTGDNYMIVGNFTVDGTIPFNFNCDVCGRSNCTLGTLPFLDEIIQIQLPKCPLPASGFSVQIGEPLPPKVYIPETIITGIIQVVSKNNNKKKQKQQQKQQQKPLLKLLHDRYDYDNSTSSSSTTTKEKEEEKYTKLQQQQQRHRKEEKKEQQQQNDTITTASSTTSVNTGSNTLVEIKATIKLHW